MLKTNIKHGPLIAKRQPDTWQEEDSVGCATFGRWRVFYRGRGECGYIDEIIACEDWSGEEPVDMSQLCALPCRVYWREPKRKGNPPHEGYFVVDEGVENALVHILAAIADALAPESKRELAKSVFDETACCWRRQQMELSL